MSTPQSRPTKSQLIYWLRLPETKWVMEQVGKKFPKWPASMPYKSLEQANSKASEQAVIETIYKLCDDEYEI